jgi:hypothetical protein
MRGTRVAVEEERIVNAETGGAKCRKKQRFELLPWEQLARVSELYAVGAEKYSDDNWRRGYQWSLSFGALHRHLQLWHGGEQLDQETGCHHLTAVVFHALTLMYFEQHHPNLDDRPNP